jgi:hypothetical protein
MGVGISLMVSAVLMWAARAPTASWALLAFTGATSLALSVLVRPTPRQRRRSSDLVVASADEPLPSALPQPSSDSA